MAEETLARAGFDAVRMDTNPWGSRTGYLTWKYFSTTEFPTDQTHSGLIFMLIRFADILLTIAAVRIELKDNLALATRNINLVRARAYGMQHFMALCT